MEDIKLENILESLGYSQSELMENTKTNVVSLDTILNGGIEERNIIQLVGEMGTYKTSIALQIALAYCMDNKKVLYIDTENTLTLNRLKNIKLDEYYNKQFYFCNIAAFSEVEKVMDKFISSGQISLIIVDSIASLINDGYLNIDGKKSKKDKGITITTNNSNYDSKPLSLFLKKYSSLANEKKYSLLLINQQRQKMDKRIGTISRRFGPKYLDNICQTIIKVNSSSTSDYAKQLSCINCGTVGEFEIVKSNCHPPKVKIPFFFVYGKGIANIYNAIYYMIKNEMIIKNGTYYAIANMPIKENGLNNLITKSYQVIKNYYEQNKEQIDNYYKSLLK